MEIVIIIIAVGVIYAFGCILIGLLEGIANIGRKLNKQDTIRLEDLFLEEVIRLKVLFSKLTSGDIKMRELDYGDQLFLVALLVAIILIITLMVVTIINKLYLL